MRLRSLQKQRPGTGECEDRDSGRKETVQTEDWRMERARNYLGLPRLRMPSLQQLRDGSFWKNQVME